MDSIDIANWLISQSILIPYSGSRVSFVHQSVTEFLAASELAQAFVRDRSIVRRKLASTRWDQALLLAASMLPDHESRSFLDFVVAADFPLALRAILGGRLSTVLAETEDFQLKIRCYAPHEGENAMHSHYNQDHSFVVLRIAALMPHKGDPHRRLGVRGRQIDSHTADEAIVRAIAGYIVASRRSGASNSYTMRGMPAMMGFSMSGKTSTWGAFLDSTLDRMGDSAIFGGLVLYFAFVAESEMFAALTLYCLVTGWLTSYARARAESLGYEAKGGIAARADRLVAVLAAAGLSDMLDVPVLLEAVLWLLAVASTVTVVQRILAVRRQARAAV